MRSDNYPSVTLRLVTRTRADGHVAQAHLLAAQVERGGEHRIVGDGGAADRLAPGAG